MARNLVAEIDGDGAVWGAGAFAASLLLGVALEPVQQDVGLENLAVLYLLLVAVTAALGGRAAGFVASASAALSYNWFSTTPYHTLRIDSAEQILTVLLMFAAGFIASLGGRTTRRASVAAREEAAAIRMLASVNLAAAGSRDADQVAARELLALLGAQAVSVVRSGRQGERVTAQAGEPDEKLDPAGLPRLDEEGRIPSGHRRAIGGLLVLPAGGIAVDLVHDGQRRGALVIEPAVDRPLLRSTRMAVAAAAHALAMCPE
jgi:K+-sensing histidine kinase KdpD